MSASRCERAAGEHPCGARACMAGARRERQGSGGAGDLSKPTSAGLTNAQLVSSAHKSSTHDRRLDRCERAAERPGSRPRRLSRRRKIRARRGRPTEDWQRAALLPTRRHTEAKLTRVEKESEHTAGHRPHAEEARPVPTPDRVLRHAGKEPPAAEPEAKAEQNSERPSARRKLRATATGSVRGRHRGAAAARSLSEAPLRSPSGGSASIAASLEARRLSWYGHDAKLGDIVISSSRAPPRTKNTQRTHSSSRQPAYTVTFASSRRQPSLTVTCSNSEDVTVKRGEGHVSAYLTRFNFSRVVTEKNGS